MYAAATQIKSIVGLYRLVSGSGWTRSTFVLQRLSVFLKHLEPSGTPELKSVAEPTRELQAHSLDSSHASLQTGYAPMNPDDPRDAMGNLDPRDLIWGKAKAAIERRLTRLDPDLERYVREFAYGEVYGRSNLPGGLEPKVQEWLAIVMLAALGSPGEIKTHLRGAINAGASEQELREVILFTIPYLGFPKAINAMQALKEYLLERETKSV